MTARCVTVNITLRIHDVRTFVRTARARAIDEGIDPEDARRIYRAGNLGECALMLIDPGESPDGAEILESTYETTP